MRNHQVNTISVVRSSDIEIFNTKNLNLTITDSKCIKIHDDVYTENLSFELAKYHTIKDYAVCKNTLFYNNMENTICENARLINSVLYGSYDTFKGYSTLCGTTLESSKYNTIFGYAYIIQIGSRNNLIFGSSNVNNITGSDSFIGGDSYINGKSTDNIIINSNYQTNNGSESKIINSDIIGANIDNIIVINSELDNKEKVVFNEHDNRLWE